MVKSLINPSVEYKETKYVDKPDHNTEASSYDIIFRDIDPNNEITVTFGKLNDTYMSSGLSYFPMYLVVDDSVKGKIGLIEIAFGSERNILDEDNEIDPEKMPEPLLFNYVNSNFIDSFKSEMLHTDDTDANTTNKKSSGLLDIFGLTSNVEEKEDKDDEDKDDKDDKDAEEDKDEKDAEEDKDDKDTEEDKEDDDEKDEKDKEDKDEKEDKDDKKTSFMDSIFSVVVPNNKEDNNQDNKEKQLEPKENKASAFFEHDENKSIAALLDEETKQDAEKQRNDFKSSSSNDWITTFMKNKHYAIHDNAGSGDCLFIVIRDAFAEVGKNTTVPKLRELLSNEVTDEIFNNYRSVFLDMDNELVETSKLVDTNKKALRQLKQSNNNPNLTREERETIIKQAKQHSDEIKKLKKENLDNETFMKYNFGFMKDIDTIEKFQEYIKTSSYWADTWAISTLEHKLNIKLVIFSEESYNENSYDSVLNCGELNKNIETSGSFNPNYYIMTTYNGNHYKTVSYKDKKILVYREIPYDIKMLVINKCLERNSGVFYMIQEFRNLKSKMGISPDEGKKKDSNDDNITMNITDNEKDVMIGNELYDPDIEFQIYHKSNNKPLPGKGSGEKMPIDRLVDFKDLRKFKEWRRKLDNDWTQTPFDLDGLRWASVTHYVEGSKFKKGFPDFYKKFSINADANETEENMINLSSDVKLAKEVGNKTKHSLRKNKEVIDPDYFGERSEKELEDAIRAKFTLSEDARSLLKATKTAKLSKFVKGSPSIEQTTLMRIRKELIQ